MVGRSYAHVQPFAPFTWKEMYKYLVCDIFIHLINQISTKRATKCHIVFLLNVLLKCPKKEWPSYACRSISQTNWNRSEHFQFNWFEQKKRLKNSTRILLTLCHRANAICRKIEHCTINLWPKWLYILLNVARLYVRPFAHKQVEHFRNNNLAAFVVVVGVARARAARC